MDDLLWERGNSMGNLTVLVHQSLLRIHPHFLVKRVTSHLLSDLQAIIFPNRDWTSIPMKRVDTMKHEKGSY